MIRVVKLSVIKSPGSIRTGLPDVFICDLFFVPAAKAMIRFAQKEFGITKFASSHVEQNRASGHVMEKCGLHFVRYGQFQKLDGTCKMRSMEYEGELDPQIV